MGRTIEIPEQFKPKASDAARFSKAFVSAITGIGGDQFAHEASLKRQEDALTHHNLSVAAADRGEVSAGGRALTGPAAAMARNHQSQVEQKKREEEHNTKMMLASLKAMGERLAELDVLIAETKAKLDENAIAREENAERLAALDEIDRLARNGELDPNDPEHADKLRLLGMSFNEAMNAQARERRRLEEEAERVRLWNQHVDLSRTYDDYTRERDEIADEVDRIASDPNQAPDVRAEAILIREARERRTEQRTIERSGGILHSNATDALRHEETTMQSVEDQISTFSRSLAQIKQIPDELERLRAEQALVQGLSEDAQMMASFDPEAEHLFVEGYFDRLNGTSKLELAAGTQPVQGLSFTN